MVDRTIDISASVDPVIRAAVDGLVRSSSSGGAVLVSLPLNYPSGTAVGVRIDPASGGFLVSDFAFGYREAESFGAQRSYAANVKKVIEAYGLEYGMGHQLFKRVAPLQLRGAIKLVAAASHELVNKVFLAAPEWDEEEISADLYQRLVSLFGRDHVSPRARIVGASSVSWKIAARVIYQGRDILFDVVSPAHASVFSAVSKFNDVIRLEKVVTPVAVVHSKDAMGKWLPLLSQVAEVIEDGAADETLREIVAEAA